MNEEYKCENCNEASFETPQQLRGHQMKCRPKEEVVEKKRRERIPFGSPEQKLGVKKEPGYHYRWFNDNWRKENLMKKLTGMQAKYLRGRAHGLKPVVFVGQRGLTDALIASTEQAFDRHELIKIKFIDFKEKKQKKEIGGFQNLEFLMDFPHQTAFYPCRL